MLAPELKKNSLSLILTLCVYGLFFNTLAWAQNFRTDSRAPYVHEISVYDGEADRVDFKDQFDARPYSPSVTCGKCHNMDVISQGWHFNLKGGSEDGRRGEPWIWVDPSTRSQIPLTYRNWPGAFHPDQLGLSEWDMVMTFGRHMAGGGPGTGDPNVNNIDRPGRWPMSGNLEIDCMICHSADPSYNAEVWAVQIEKQNLKWAPSAAAGLASVLGTAEDLSEDFDPEFPEFSDPGAEPPRTRYDQSLFGTNSLLYFDIAKKPRDERCYYCHTTQPVDGTRPKFAEGVDIHLSAGMGCSDCHRHGLDHRIDRGIADQSNSSEAAVWLTCRACHIGQPESGDPELLGGQMGAPIAQHKGLPPLHLEKLSCTACHSGPWPSAQSRGVQTSLAHGLGLAREDRQASDLPMLVESVFLQQDDGVIAPHRLLWPAFWAKMRGDSLVPLPLADVQKQLARLLADEDEEESGHSNQQPISAEGVVAALGRIQTLIDTSEVSVYVTGGKAYRLSGETLVSFEHDAAQPYTWPLAHAVRGKARSLGVRGCSDCHASDAPFYFGTVPVDNLTVSGADSHRSMTEFLGTSAFYAKIFALSFLFPYAI